MAKVKYTKRIVAFADILGWSNAINSKQFASIYKAVTSIANHAGTFSPEMKDKVKTCRVEPFIKKYESVEFSYFSDSLVISVAPDYGEFLFSILSFSAVELLRAGFLTRGGVTIGDLYHDKGVVFGPALNEAVDIEQKEALYPRILCSRKLLSLLKKKPYQNEVILKDCCQEWVANIACGSSINENDLMLGVRRETHKKESVDRKWRYMETMLPKMFIAKSMLS